MDSTGYKIEKIKIKIKKWCIYRTFILPLSEGRVAVAHAAPQVEYKRRGGMWLSLKHMTVQICSTNTNLLRRHNMREISNLFGTSAVLDMCDLSDILGFGKSRGTWRQFFLFFRMCACVRCRPSWQWVKAWHRVTLCWIPLTLEQLWVFLSTPVLGRISHRLVRFYSACVCSFYVMSWWTTASSLQHESTDTLQSYYGTEKC